MNQSASPILALEQARDRTLAAGSARFELTVDHEWSMPPMPRRRRGGVLRPVLKAGKAAGKQLVKTAARGFDFDFRHQTGEGIIDFAARRYMLDFGGFANVYENGELRHGPSGRPPPAPAEMGPAWPNERPHPLWLMDLLAGVAEATDVGEEPVRGVPTRHVDARVDLGRASQVAPGGVRVPAADRFETLLALPVDVWVDDQIRRVRFSHPEQTETLELWDLGVDVANLDWSRMPAFRSSD